VNVARVIAPVQFHFSVARCENKNGRIPEDHGVITRSDPAGDIRMTVDFSNVIPPTDLNI
jgi:hypothetical protein